MKRVLSTAGTITGIENGSVVLCRRFSRQKGSFKLWVPPAYRGQQFYGDYDEYSRSSRRGTGGGRTPPVNHTREIGRHSNMTRGKNFHGKHNATLHQALHRHNRDDNNNHGRERRNNNKHEPRDETEERILCLYTDIMRILADYRKIIGVKADSDTPTLRNLGRNYGNDKLGTLSKMTNRIKDATRGLHTVMKVPVAWTQIVETEDCYRNICMILQNIIILSKTHTINFVFKSDSKLIDPADTVSGVLLRKHLLELAETSLVTLVELQEARRLLVDEARKLSAETRPPKTEKKKKSPILDFVNNIVAEYLPWRSGHVVNNNDEELVADIMAHDVPELHVTHKIFGYHIRSKFILTEFISSLPPDVAIPAALLNSHGGGGGAKQGTARNAQSMFGGTEIKSRAVYTAAARRMAYLLDKMPSEWIPDKTAYDVIMETLRRCGNLESARSSYAIYGKYPSYLGRFSLVMNAFLEAAKVEGKNKNRQVKILQEATSAFDEEWTKKEQPSLSIESVMQCSILLNIMLVANSATNSDLCEAADLIVQRCLSEEGYRRLQEDIELERPLSDSQILPLVNHLTQIYASSKNQDQVDKAKRLLKCMMNVGGGSNFTPVPDASTINAMIKSVIRRYVRIPLKTMDAESARTDLDYATSLVNYMCSHPDAGCLPNNDTFDLLFRLIFTVKPADIRQRAEVLLGQAEIAQFYQDHNKNSNGSIVSLSIYNHVLWCLVQSVKNASPIGDEEACIDCCERALRLLIKCDAQSTPFFLHEIYIQQSEVTNLYDFNLRPTQQLYNAVLKMCFVAATKACNDKQVQERVAALAMHVYQRMMLASRLYRLDKGTKQLLTQCCELLPETSEMRNEFESLLASQPASKADTVIMAEV